MMSKKFILAVSAVMAMLPMSSAFAEDISIPTRQGRGADAPVQNGASRDKNMGGHGQLWVKKGVDKSYARKSYLRFDVSGQTTGVKSATLKLAVGDAYAKSPEDKVWTFNVYGVRDGLTPVDTVLGEDWDEKAITWANAPANDVNSSDGVTADATLLGTFTVTAKGTPGEIITFTSPELTKFIQDDKNGLVSLVLTRPDSDTKVGLDDVVHVFATKEQRAYALPTLVLSK